MTIIKHPMENEDIIRFKLTWKDRLQIAWIHYTYGVPKYIIVNGFITVGKGYKKVMKYLKVNGYLEDYCSE